MIDSASPPLLASSFLIIRHPLYGMGPSVDAAILDALGLDASQTKIASHGGSGFASTFKLSTSVCGRPMNYFVKTGSGKAAEVMFRGSHENAARVQ